MRDQRTGGEPADPQIPGDVDERQRAGAADRECLPAAGDQHLVAGVPECVRERQQRRQVPRQGGRDNQYAHPPRVTTSEPAAGLVRSARSVIVGKPPGRVATGSGRWAGFRAPGL
ncbi:hypothetical protein PSA01_56680 [Pseudonocardia saturnea]|uniref:Uncharacterized protein n=1 Tax=Pseudonocardia saturnea TaxID=33909 RepID=A0ABQ0S6U7_9PSEU|nr:hypothetical protein Pdca_01270 [Pseudonocardia autotrophica]GEC28639.1 hypothetical protein PSA01_56680 [Pseudonocardia saturnea]